MKKSTIGMLGRAVLLFLMVVVAYYLLAWWIETKQEEAALMKSERINVPVKQLLMETPDTPEDLFDFTWRIGNNSRNSEKLGPKEDILRGWTKDGDFSYPMIVQHVLKYESPIKANQYFDTHRPEDYYSGVRDQDPDKRYPKHFPYRSPYADQEHVVCGAGEPENCGFWYYWARYGQYNLLIVYKSGDYPGSPDVFADIVAPFDRYVGEQLRKAAQKDGGR